MIFKNLNHEHIKVPELTGTDCLKLEMALLITIVSDVNPYC